MNYNQLKLKISLIKVTKIIKHGGVPERLDSGPIVWLFGL